MYYVLGGTVMSLLQLKFKKNRIIVNGRIEPYPLQVYL